jgi:2-dehydro-3-deoxygalactonokinase
MESTLLGIDWGTSNRRAYLVDRDGRLLATHSDDQGALAVRGRFPEALADLLARMRIGADVPVVMSGMVGSANGWKEVPYLSTDIPLLELPRHLARIDDPSLGGRFCAIVPGYCQRSGAIDVMRGEETQLLGAVAQGRADGWVVLPGTHSKWVLLREGRIERFSTFMTGELFAALGASGTLAPLFKEGADDDAAFAAGVQEARGRAPLSNALFGVRARVVAGAMPASQARDFASGLLIGAEFVAAHEHRVEGALALLGSPALLARYARAAALFGIEVETLDADALYIAALTRFFDEAHA